MSTREENLQKINEELEKLDDEQLEEVAGGSYVQVADDSRLLYEYGMTDKFTTPGGTILNYSRYSDTVDAGWKKAGIRCVSRYSGDNDYYMKDTGKQISCDEARRHLMKNYKQVRVLYLDFYGY